MFTTLLESHAPQAVSTSGTVASLLVHASIAIGAVTITLQAPDGARAEPVSVARGPIIYVEPPPPSAVATRPRVGGPRDRRAQPAPLVVPPPNRFICLLPYPKLPLVEPGPVFKDDFLPGRAGIPTSGSVEGPAREGAEGGGVLQEDEVDRAPQVIGAAPQPRYPDALRAAGITGRVVAEFVVDTLGRAELGTVEMDEATRPEFAESVRAALPRFRFTAGEAGGRLVRTRVRMPFAFRMN